MQSLLNAPHIGLDPDDRVSVKAFGQIAFRRHERRFTVGPGFKKRHWQSLAERGEDERVAARVAGRLRFAKLGAEEGRGGVETVTRGFWFTEIKPWSAQLARQLLQLRFVPSLVPTGDRQQPLRLPGCHDALLTLSPGS